MRTDCGRAVRGPGDPGNLEEMRPGEIHLPEYQGCMEKSYETLAKPAVEIAEAVFEMMVVLHDVQDQPESAAEEEAWTGVMRRLDDLRDDASELAGLIGRPAPTYRDDDPTGAFAELLALVMEARRTWRRAEHPEGRVTAVEGSAFADTVSQLERLIDPHRLPEAGELAEHLAWHWAETQCLVDVVGGQEWLGRHNGTCLAETKWLEQHERVVAELDRGWRPPPEVSAAVLSALLNAAARRL